MRGTRLLRLVLLTLAVPVVSTAQHQHAAPAATTAPTRAAAAADERMTPAVITTAPALTADAPFQCWWRASSGAIRLGEVVDVALTCAVLETGGVTAVADESRLTVAAVQLSPFEIVDGTHPPDVRSGDRRFFQYRYRLRIINPDVIGHDVKLPPLSIPYKLQSRVGAATTMAGRDLVHLMPQLVFRVVSQVPDDADDIRDSADASFAEIERLRFRGNAFSVASMVLTLIGGIAALSALVPVAGLWRRRQGPAVVARLSERVVLQGATRLLGDRLEAARVAGWTPETLAEAHGATRVVTAVALGRPVREVVLAAGAAVPEGRLVVRHRLGRQASAVTAPITTDVVARALAALPATASAASRQRLERLHDALAALTRAQYGAAPDRDTTAIDDAVAAARDIGATIVRERRFSPRAWFRRPVAPAASTPEF